MTPTTILALVIAVALGIGCIATAIALLTVRREP
jgi:hypothetical protein